MEWVTTPDSNPSGNCPQAQMLDGQWRFRNDLDTAAFLVFTPEEWQNGNGVNLEPCSEFGVPLSMRHAWAAKHPENPDPIWFSAHGRGPEGQRAVVYLTVSEKQSWEKDVADGKWTAEAYLQAEAALA